MTDMIPDTEPDAAFPEAADFDTECRSIAALLSAASEQDFDIKTRFKNWTVNDIMGPLHLWNIAADQTLHGPDTFTAFITKAMSGLASGQSHRGPPRQHARRPFGTRPV